MRPLFLILILFTYPSHLRSSPTPKLQFRLLLILVLVIALWILHLLRNTTFQFLLFRLFASSFLMALLLTPSSPAHFDYPSSSLPVNLRLWTFLSFRLTPLAPWFLD